MNDVEVMNQNPFDRVVKFLKENTKLYYLISFLIALVIPLSSTKIDNLITLTERSVNRWVGALNTFTNDLVVDSLLLVNSGIDRTIEFIQNLFNFYIKIITFDFDIIREVGFILIAIYILIPILFIFILIRLLFFINKTAENYNTICECRIKN